ncbi:DNA base-flipping protein [invertebrate metagenome]|uniref:DNA base-flipping protein n=1 Tax=invertebrate metagenome TaxID=1711999 RepID=A0A2H9TCI9_9ZZZZ
MSCIVTPEIVWYVLSRVPKGQVVTYGQLANMVNAPGYARVVGHILKQLPSGSGIPWYRVVNSKGRISFPEGSALYRKQQEKLAGEGVFLTNGKIDFGRYRWDGN